MNVHHHYHGESCSKLDEVIARLARIETMLRSVKTEEDIIMHTADDTLAAVTAEDSKIDSIIAYTSGLKQQLADALAGITLPPATQAKIDQIFDLSTASAAKVDAAMVANVPPTTP